MKYKNFHGAIEKAREDLRVEGQLIDANRWQSINIPDHVRFREITNVYFTVDLRNELDIDYWVEDIKPNIPWADLAFHERVAGIPWNPGKAWEQWPYARSAQNFKQEQFSHSYAERYWPKHANQLTDQQWRGIGSDGNDYMMFHRNGIRFTYGDLDDVVDLLAHDPLTRQAYLPMWFPEDTGVVHGTRVPCSLGYHFMQRNDRLSITYYIRSCDFVRHFRDDLYMTLRLLMWVSDKLPYPTYLGDFIFHCGSLHAFENDKL